MQRRTGAISVSSAVQTPETYLGTFRAHYSQTVHAEQAVRRTRAAAKPVRQRRAAPGAAGASRIRRSWRARARTSLLRYVAPRIYVVAAPPAGAAGSLSASVDGKALPRIRVPHDDLYQLAHLAKPGPHALDLSVRRGTSLYSFTFG